MDVTCLAGRVQVLMNLNYPDAFLDINRFTSMFLFKKVKETLPCSLSASSLHAKFFVWGDCLVHSFVFPEGS